MDFVKDMRARAARLQKKLVLAEGTEPRTVKAARILVDEKLAASVTLVGAKAEVEAVASKEGVNLEGIVVVEPAASPFLESYAQMYFDILHKKEEAKKAKGQPVDRPITLEKAKAEITAQLRWGAMMVHRGDADAMVAGAESATADVLRAGLAIVGTVSKTASSCFVVHTTDPSWGAGGSLIFSDCAVIPEPTEEQLADIAVSAAQSCRELLEAEPVVALLSFSTKGSAAHEAVTKVQNACTILKGKNPDFVFDGELQADAALVPSVTDKKAPGSPIRGKVNVLVFPNLGAGNIGYKLVQRLGKAEAFGPFLQGFAKPISDLSRGASVDDIVTTAAVTLSRAK
ncbi:phosphate acetyltransferase [Spirochaetia bacterium]|nr:phosphate acetyltransferase [Spirochaetia bacterium]GHU33305.1 phosphate acetyltransferase [Spirochaetia bacterium]